MSNRSKILMLLFCVSLISLNACHYKPFVGYLMNKKGFKHFSKTERIAGDNTNPERNYKVNRYDWTVQVFPYSKSIQGKMDIVFTALSDQNVFLFDLQKRMKIESFNSTVGNPTIKRKKDFLYLEFEENVPANTRIKLSIIYEGKPVSVAGEGPIQWKEDKKGRTWISTLTEGVGPHFIMPCNALLVAESDSSSISVTVPADLVAVANGRLVDEVLNEVNNTKTFKYEITNPINTYSLSFNVGHFVELRKPYTDINGVARNLTFHVLDYNKDTADIFYEQTSTILNEFEKLFGVFPFWEDGCKFIESTFSAMEHQSGIAMGSNYKNSWKDYNTTLVHELSHEWWGNSLSGKDYCDIWMHEGMATYAEALFIEKIYGAEAYDLNIKYAGYNIENLIPIYKKCDVLYNSWVNAADRDIYNKGALMMHSLRKVVNNDSLFFHALYIIQQEYPKQNISTGDLIEKFNTVLGHDYTELFDWYLNEVKPPILDFYIDKEADLVYYKWRQEIPFYQQGEVFIKQGDEIYTLIPTTEYQTQKLKDGIGFNFQVEQSIYYLLDMKKSLKN